MGTPSVEVNCARQSIRSAVLDWLRHDFPRPARTLQLQIMVGEPMVPPTFKPVFEQPATRFFTLADTLCLESTSAPAVAFLDAAPVARVVLSEQAAGRMDETMPHFLSAVVTMLYRRIGWHHVHAAMLEDPEGRCWLFAGNSGSGKSTTAALLAARDWLLGGDDGVFLTAKHDVVTAHAITKPPALRPGGMELLARGGGRFAEHRGKTEFEVAELTARPVSTATPDIVAFTRVAGDSTVVTSIGGSAILAELVQWSAWVALERSFAQEHLDLLARLGRQAQCYSVTLAPDVTLRPQMLMEATL